MLEEGLTLDGDGGALSLFLSTVLHAADLGSTGEVR